MSTLAVKIYQTLQARANCIRPCNYNKKWERKWEGDLVKIERNCLPRGSGIDSGTIILRDGFGPDQTSEYFKLGVDYHHMNDVGYYDGWTSHILTVRPAFGGIDITIDGPDKDDIHEYLSDLFYWVLQEEYKGE